MLPTGALLINRYRILHMESRGGQSVVYRAEDTRLGDRLMAIKELVPPPSASDDLNLTLAADAFRLETSLLARLDHPNLPDIYDSFEQDGNFYVAMEFIAGRTLASQLRGYPEGSVPEAQVLEWARQLCDVLEYLHRQQPPVVFRDLKPGNVMLDSRGQVKLIDFGIARHFKPGQRADTQAMGTPGFAAPEQYGTGQTDARSDVYSLGMTLHNLLTGYDPSANPFQIPPAISLNPRASAQTSAAIQRALNMDPRLRYQTIREFRQALPISAPADWAQGPVLPPPTDQTLPPPPPPMRRRRTSAWLVSTGVLGGLALLFCVVAVLAYPYLSGSRSPPTFPPTPTRLFTLDGITATPPAGEIDSTGTLAPTRVGTELPTEAPVALPTDIRLAFVSDRDGPDVIYVAGLDGSGALVSPNGLPAPAGWDIAWWPEWCQGNSVILFEAQDTSSANKQTIFAIASDGSGAPQPANLAQPENTDRVGVARCSPDSRHIAYSAHITGSENLNWPLYLYDTSAGASSQFGPGYSFGGNVSWFRDGSPRFIFMFRAFDNRSSRFFMRLTSLDQPGTATTYDSPGFSDTKYPAVSPDGTQIAFACNDGRWQLCLMRADGSNPRVLSREDILQTSRSEAQPKIPQLTPVWSPDGRWIAYSSTKSGGQWDIFLLNPVTDEKVNLTAGWPGGKNEFLPSWSQP